MSKVHLKNAFYITRANFKQQDTETKPFQSTFSFFIVCTASRSISTANILSSPLLLMECDCYVEADCLSKCRGKQLQMSLHFAIEKSLSFIFDLHFANSGVICRQVICAEFCLQTIWFSFERVQFVLSSSLTYLYLDARQFTGVKRFI